jgi:ATP/maltotriose-dependent transcriptional regulator MalT
MPTATPFVGRGSELGLLDTALASAEAGRSAAVEIVGPAGIGKSRLLAELSARADARGHIALTGSGAEFEQDLPFWVFVDALDEYVAGVDPRRLERLDPVVRAELGQVLPSLADAGGAPAPALHERYRTHRAVRALLEQLAATKPLVLTLDDVHWADPASTDLLVALLHRPPAAGVLLLIAARPRQLPPRLATALDRAHRAGTLDRLELDPLTREQARELVGAPADALYEESGGNPFYLEQLARAPGSAPSPAAGGGGTALGGVDVPPMVAAALAEELALLSDPARTVLNAAAVAGDPFEIDLAAAAAAMDETAVLAALDELTRIELVRPTDTPRRFRFRHPIVRRAVYEGSPDGWRITAHERAAGALAERGAPSAARAHHVERSARQGDLDAAALLGDAGRESLLRAPATAARFFASALRLLPASAPAEQRVALLLPMGQALAADGQFSAARETLLESIELAPAGARALRVELAAMCARVEHLLGLHEEAHERLVHALDELPDEASAEGISLLVELSMDPLHRMNYQAMTDWGDRAGRAAERIDDPALRAVALAVSARGVAVPGGGADAEERRARAAALIDSLSDEELARRLDAAMYLAGTELYLHRFEDANAHSVRLLRIGRQTGQGALFPLVYSTLGITWFMMGRLRESVDELDGAIEAARLSGNAQALVWSFYPRAKIALAAGDVALAVSLAQEAADLADDGRINHHFAHAAFALAEAHLELGRPEPAAELLERSSGGPDMPLAALSFRAYFIELLVRCRLALGDLEAAERAAAVARESADAVGLPLARAWADRATAAVALERGDAARAAELASAAAAGAAAAGAAVDAALAQTLAGRALAAAGDRDGAVEALRQAAGEFERIGALRYRDAAERELRRLGERIHRRSQPTAADGEGVAALTKRELEIARLIVDRRTNRQIAEELYLSPKTVETHIRNIFAKLGADSRVEVARIVERADRAAAPAP